MSEQQCQGWRRTGGAFSLGPVSWKQCKETPTVLLMVRQNGKTEKMAACATCWQECIENQLEIMSAIPIKENL